MCCKLAHHVRSLNTIVRLKNMNIKEDILSTIQQYRSQAIIGLFGLLFGLLTNVLKQIPISVLDALPNRPILLALAGSLLLVLILTSWIYSILREDKLTLKDGIYWDKENNPHCPACKTPLLQTKDQTTHIQFHCLKCPTNFCG